MSGASSSGVAGETEGSNLHDPAASGGALRAPTRDPVEDISQRDQGAEIGRAILNALHIGRGPVGRPQSLEEALRLSANAESDARIRQRLDMVFSRIRGDVADVEALGMFFPPAQVISHAAPMAGHMIENFLLLKKNCCCYYCCFSQVGRK